jgi:prepilin-type N-terminal cleavage/methylation domain-containing protein
LEKRNLRQYPIPAWRRTTRQGFTLIEVLVTLILIGLLVPFVFPIITGQIERYESIRVARDLTAFRTALNQYMANVLAPPRYLNQMTGAITSTDSTAGGRAYSSRQVNGWIGPYLDEQLDATLRADPAMITGYDAIIQNQIRCFANTGNVTVTCGPGTLVAVRIDGLIGNEFELVNDLIDGESEPNGRGLTRSRGMGRLRFTNDFGIDLGTSLGITWYLATPYAAP